MSLSGLVWRGIASVVTLSFFGTLQNALSTSVNTVATIGAGNAAVLQFQPSNRAAVASNVGMNFFSNLSAPDLGIFTFLVLLTIWWSYISKGFKLLFTTSAIAVMFLATSTPSLAYYGTYDYTEVHYILPNESAFLVPDVGDNASSQAEFGSLAYYQQNKVAAKRIQIPHVELPGIGSLWDNYYVPAARLIIVDRTPYTREWVASSNRGTSQSDQSMPCQSQEGLNVTAEVGITVSVKEADVATFLYNFGTKKPVVLDSNGAVLPDTDPNVVFTSVYYGRDLNDVMDSTGQQVVSGLVCKEISSLPLDQVNAQRDQIMTTVTKEATYFFASRGITLDYMGWAGPFTFDPDVQIAINQAYEATKIAPVLDTLKTKAAIDAANKWNGQLPTTMSGLWLLPSEIMDSIEHFFDKSQS